MASILPDRRNSSIFRVLVSSLLQATAVRPWEELTLRAISDPQYYDDGREMPSSQNVYTANSGQPAVCEALSAIDPNPRPSPSAERAYSFQGFQGRKTTRPRQAPFSSALSYNESSPQRTFPRLAAAGKADGLIMLAPKGSPAGPQA